MKSKRATVSEWRAEDKTVLFIPMIHIATPDFYKNVRTIIESKKAEGFIVIMKELNGRTSMIALKSNY